MTQIEYNARLNQLARDIAAIGAIIRLVKAGETGRATLETIWRFGWKPGC